MTANVADVALMWRSTTDTYDGPRDQQHSNSISWQGWSPLLVRLFIRLCALLKIGVHSRIPARRWPDIRRIVYRRAFCRVHSRHACVFIVHASVHVHKRLWKGNRRGEETRDDVDVGRERIQIRDSRGSQLYQNIIVNLNVCSPVSLYIWEEIYSFVLCTHVIHIGKCLLRFSYVVSFLNFMRRD